MRKEFHFSIVYALARCAGIPEQISEVIANCSQFIDDNNYHFVIKTNNNSIVYHTPTAYKPQQFFKFFKQTNCFEPVVYFHFLPSDASLVVTPFSYIVENLTQYLSTTSEAYELGIGLHVIADAYSHQDFIGIYSYRNKVRILYWRKYISSLLKNIISILPPMGHGMAYFLPDIPNIYWGYKRNGEKFFRDNNIIFLDAIKHLYKILVSYANTKLSIQNCKSKSIDEIQELFTKALQKCPYNKKLAYKYMQQLIHTNFFNFEDFNKNNIDAIIEYSATTWIDKTFVITKTNNIIKTKLLQVLFKLKLLSYYECDVIPSIESYYYFKFLQAVGIYKSFVNHQLPFYYIT